MAKLTLFYKCHIILTHDLGKKPVLIGNDLDCDIQINGRGIAEQHAVIHPQGDEYIITRHDESTPISVNYSNVVSQRLAHGDIIQIGSHVLSFGESGVKLDFVPPAIKSKPRDEATQEGDHQGLKRMVDTINTLPTGCIQITRGRHVGRIIPLQRSLTRLGLTGNECAVIAHRSDGYYLSHLEGNLSPTIDGQPIGEHSMRLNEGSIIRIGNIEMRFFEENSQIAAM